MNRFFLIICFLALIARADSSAAELEKLSVAKKEFNSIPNPTEADRQNYLIKLSKLRDSLARIETHGGCFVVDAEIRMHPAPEDTKAYTELMVGEWSSPRHEYIYRADGTWSMLPEEEGTTRGQWRIEGNRFLSKADGEPSDAHAYTILLLTKDNFIFTDGETVFYEERIRDDANQDNVR